MHRLRQGAADLLRHVLLPRRLRLLAAVRRRRRRRERQGPAGRRTPRSSASASRPASTCPARRRAGSPTGTGSWPTGRPTRTTTARSAKTARHQRLPARVRPRVLHRGLRLPRRRRRQLRDRPGRHHRHAAPARPGLRRARPTAARSTSRGSARRSSTPDGKVVRRIPPRRCGHGRRAARGPRLHRQALLGTAKVGTMAWKMVGFPLDKVHDPRPRPARPRSTASRATSWVASLRQGVRRDDDGHPGRHRLGHVRRRRSARSGRRCTASTARRCARRRAAIPGAKPPAGLPVVRRRRRDPAARRPAQARGVSAMTVTSTGPRRTARRARVDGRPACASRGLDWMLMLAAAGAARARHAAGVVGHLEPRDDLTGGDPNAYLTQAARQHRHRRRARGAGRSPPTTAGCGSSRRWSTSRRSSGCVLVLVDGRDDQRVALVDPARRHVDPAGGVRQARRRHRDGAAGRRADRGRAGGARRRHRRRGRRCSRSPGVPAALILLQPDLGTMLVLSATVFGVIAVAGARRAAGWSGLALGGGRRGAVAAVPLGVLKGYQLDRFMAFTNPGLDPRGAGYNTDAGAHRDRQRRRSSGRACSTARRPSPASCPSSTPTSSSPSPARSSGWSGAARPDRAARGVLSGGRCASPPRRRPVRPASPPPASPAGSASRRSRTSACASASCRSPASRCRSCRTAARSMFAGLMALGLLQNIHLRSGEGIGVARSGAAPLAASEPGRGARCPRTGRTRRTGPPRAGPDRVAPDGGSRVTGGAAAAHDPRVAELSDAIDAARGRPTVRDGRRQSLGRPRRR